MKKKEIIRHLEELNTKLHNDMQILIEKDDDKLRSRGRTIEQLRKEIDTLNLMKEDIDVRRLKIDLQEANKKIVILVEKIEELQNEVNRLNSLPPTIVWKETVPAPVEEVQVPVDPWWEDAGEKLLLADDDTMIVTFNLEKWPRRMHNFLLENWLEEFKYYYTRDLDKYATFIYKKLPTSEFDHTDKYINFRRQDIAIRDFTLAGGVLQIKMLTHTYSDYGAKYLPEFIKRGESVYVVPMLKSINGKNWTLEFDIITSAIKK